MNFTNLTQIQEKLSLRKLSVSKTIHKNKEVFRLVIGYVQDDPRMNLKVNFLSNLLPETLTEETVEAFVVQEVESFKSSMDKLIEKGLHSIDVLSSEKKAVYTDFKNSFSGAVGNFSDTKLKTEQLNDVFKRHQKKIKLLEKVHEEEKKLKSILEKLQINAYHSYFTTARRAKRKLRLYVGPTNSGKTFRALNDLARHEQGVYLSPLRLLAWEGKEELEKRGKPTSLITGEERQETENAKFKSQTIETLNFHEVVDAVLIDEIQMLFEEDRGWAWTQALIGAPCKELIMAGSPEAEPLVKRIADLLGEELEIIRLHRFNPLEVKTHAYKFPDDINLLPEGSAIIAFSRKNVLGFKSFFEKENKPVSVIYGNLSPEVRKEEARRFRDGETKFLIATDAISMGLNLPISTIIFSTVEKFDGKEMNDLSPMQVKQIAGRAGRYGKVEKGEVSSFHKDDIKFIKNMLQSTGAVNEFLYIKPSWDHVQKLAKELNTDKLFPILSFFTNNIMQKGQGLYFCSSLDEQKTLAYKLDQVRELSLEDKFLFVNAPVPSEDQHYIFLRWINQYNSGREVPMPKVDVLNPKDFYHERQLILETYVKLLNLYSWLCFKKEEFFTDKEECSLQRSHCNTEIESLLSQTQKKK